MTDGQRLRQFVENQSRSVKRIYTDLGLSKQGWYNYYDTDRMEQHTKKRIEEYFGKSIFGELVNIDPVQKDAPVSDFKADYGQDFSERVIADLAASNKAYGLAEQDRAHAAVIREQNNRDMLALLTKQSEAISKEVGQFVNETVGNFQALRAAISALQGVVIAQLPKAEQPKVRKILESHAALILNRGNVLQAQNKREKNIHDGGNR